jgi:hypothetical protein
VLLLDYYSYVCPLLHPQSSLPLTSSLSFNAVEFLPTNRRFLLAMLSTFQPVGVVTACLIAWGLVPYVFSSHVSSSSWRFLLTSSATLYSKYSCDATLPACSTGQAPCCNKSSNMGWSVGLHRFDRECKAHGSSFPFQAIPDDHPWLPHARRLPCSILLVQLPGEPKVRISFVTTR